MEYKKTIYKKDTKGKIRFLTVSSDNGYLIQESGILGGKVVPHKSLCKAKNVGRANETTPEEQARAEAESKIVNKMDGGYFDTIEEATNEVVILPMLAKKFEDEVKKIIYPCFVQPKLDGMRCLIVIKDGKVKMMSRAGKEITTMPHILQEVKDVLGSGSLDLILDGELYIHGETFQKNISLIKKYRKGQSEKVLFRWYDIVNNDPFEYRSVDIDMYLVHGTPLKYVTSVGTFRVQDEDEIKTLHGQFLEEGYEGTMVRWGGDGYKVGGRSSNLLKYKDFLDEDYLILDIIPSDKIPTHGKAFCRGNEKKWLLLSSSGEITRISDTEFEAAGEVVYDYPTFTCGMKLTHAEREDILTNKDEHIGKLANIRFFEYTDSGLPRFPVYVGTHEDR